MFNDRIKLSSAEIFEKEFKIDARGYRLQEVDKFLDIVIHDYNEYNSIIKELAINNNKLSEENEELKTEIRNLKSAEQSKASEVSESSEKPENSESNIPYLRGLLHFL